MNFAIKDTKTKDTTNELERCAATANSLKIPNPCTILLKILKKTVLKVFPTTFVLDYLTFVFDYA